MKSCTRHDSDTVATDVCNISLWSVEYILNHSTSNFDLISNSIEMTLVGRDLATINSIKYQQPWFCLNPEKSYTL